MTVILANDEAAQIVKDLQTVKYQIKKLLKAQERLTQQLYNYMGENEVLASVDGEEIVTWKYTADSLSFNAKKFKEDSPDIYDAYIEIKPGHRRLLLKEIE